MTQKYDVQISSPEILELEIGRRLSQMRIAQDFSQEQLAKEAGISRRTITRVENGKGTSLDTLIRVSRVLGVLEFLIEVFPENSIQPVARLKNKERKVRKRARRKANKNLEAFKKTLNTNNTKTNLIWNVITHSPSQKLVRDVKTGALKWQVKPGSPMKSRKSKK